MRFTTPDGKQVALGDQALASRTGSGNWRIGVGAARISAYSSRGVVLGYMPMLGPHVTEPPRNPRVARELGALLGRAARWLNR